MTDDLGTLQVGDVTAADELIGDITAALVDRAELRPCE
jgi:hypothetical protein